MQCYIFLRSNKHLAADDIIATINEHLGLEGGDVVMMVTKIVKGCYIWLPKMLVAAITWISSENG